MLKNSDDFKNYSKTIREWDKDNNTLKLSFQLTAECNFRCTYCYEHKKSKSVEKADVLMLIDKLFDMKDYPEYWGSFLNGPNKDIVWFDFFGGECTLEIDTMEAICERFYNNCLKNQEKYKTRLDNWKIIIQTNGSLLSTPKVASFINKWEKYMIISMTIDGSKEFHDKCRRFKDTNKPTWDIVVNNYKWLKENYPNIPFQTKGTISHDNLPFLYETYLGYKELGLKNFGLSVGIGLDWEDGDEAIAKEQFDLIIQDMLKYDEPPVICSHLYADKFKNDLIQHVCAGIGTCGANGNQLSISPWGRLHICSQWAEITQDSLETAEKFCVGNIKTGINSKKFNEVCDIVLNSYDKKSLEDAKCRGCSYRIACESCPAFAYKSNKDVNLMDKRHCNILKIQQAAAIRYQYLKEKKKWKK